MPGEKSALVSGPRDEAVSGKIVEIWKTHRRHVCGVRVRHLAARIAHSPGRRAWARIDRVDF